MSELVEFIRGCLDADEQTARAAIERSKVYTGPAPLRWMWSVTDGESSGLQATRHDPARVLAEVNAKRAILDLHPHVFVEGDGRFMGDQWVCQTCDLGGGNWWCPTVRALAQPYAGEPGWRDEWGTQ